MGYYAYIDRMPERAAVRLSIAYKDENEPGKVMNIMHFKPGEFHSVVREPGTLLDDKSDAWMYIPYDTDKQIFQALIDEIYRNYGILPQVYQMEMDSRMKALEKLLRDDGK